MKATRRIASTVLALALLTVGPAGLAQTGRDLNGRIQHGEYLVKNIAMCGQCHTPRTSNGNLLEEEFLRGAPIPVRGPQWASAWALRAPNIVGLSAWTVEQSVTFFKTGIRPDGTRANPPMPQFRMNQEDAESVVAYLKHLGKME